MSLLVRGGRVITAESERDADVLIEGGLVVAVEPAIDASAAEVLDARGCYVLPGAVDSHTHLDMPWGRTNTCDDFTSGTVAAACGGTTTIVDFCIQQPGQRISEALAEWHAKLERTPPIIDVGFHIAVTDPTGPHAAADLAAAVRGGVTSFKLFMAYKGSLMVDDEALFRTMRIAAEHEALVLVHAENGGVVEVLVEEALSAGDTAPRFHGLTRPPAVEAEATARAIALARMAGCDLFVVHVSCAEALAPVAAARAAGERVWAETCPQYLLLDETALNGPGFEGAKAVFTPPPRAVEHQEHLWRALADDDLCLVSTDHCPYTFAEQKALGRADFSKIPNGAPGIEHRLALMHEFGVRGGHFGLSRLVEIVATNPAKIFGLHPRKGTLAPGGDADLVIFDPKMEHVCSSVTEHSRVDYCLYEGVRVRGRARTVVARGRVVVRDTEPVAVAGRGSYVARRGVSWP
ncbi:MAG: dihydropyrimidinase [Solirubrobacteraceae bacterium]